MVIRFKRRFQSLVLIHIGLMSATVLRAEDNGWPKVPRASPEAPSVLLIMTDDVGFGASSAFGGMVETPTFDALAREGLRYNNFTTTGICSPTRAALLTGRNHNTVNIGNVTDAAASGDGYTSVIPKSAATVARILADSGYATAMFGKGHITPMWELGPTGPFDRWPTGLGFHHFYGFMMGDTNQFAPALYNGTTPVEPHLDDPEYILDRDLADNAIGWIRTQRGANPAKPFFIYYAPGTAHAPLQAPAEWIARYRGAFDEGWDVLREKTLARQKLMGIVPKTTVAAKRPDFIPAWDTLSDRQKAVYAREMEVFAAALSFADQQTGRVIEEARKANGGNLMVVFIQGDNGGSGEGGLDGTINEHGVVNGFTGDFATIEAMKDKMGGPETLTGYSAGWAFATNTPFPWVKQVASHFGATRNGMVINWAGKIATPGAVRNQYHHVIDVAPTILEAARVTPPDQVDGVRQLPLDGISMSYSFGAQPAAGLARQKQYFLIWDNMAIYQDGWIASSAPAMLPWKLFPDILHPAQVEGRAWELYKLDKDFGQTRDVATRYPEKLAELKALFFSEAGRHNGLPIRRSQPPIGRPDLNAGISTFRFTGPVSRINPDAAPPIIGRSFDIEAKITVPQAGAGGTILALGGKFGGLALFLNEGRPTFEYNFFNHARSIVAAPAKLESGVHIIRLTFDRDQGFLAPARMALSVNGGAAQQATVPRSAVMRLTLDEGFDIGSDTGTPVSDAYRTPNQFSGTIEDVVLTVR